MEFSTVTEGYRGKTRKGVLTDKIKQVTQHGEYCLKID